MRATLADMIEGIADDVNDTIRLEFKLGGSFTEQEVDTLIESKIFQGDPCKLIEIDEVKEFVDLNLIGV